MNFTQNSSTNQQFSQQSSSYQHHQQQVGIIPPQNNFHQSQQQHPQLWTTDSQQTNNYHPQQASNNSNGFSSNNIGKADISNSNSFRGQSSNPAVINPLPPPTASHQEVAGFNNQATPAASNHQQNITSAVSQTWNDTNASQQNIDPAWNQQMGSNWSQQAQQRTYDYVQQCPNWST